MINTRKKLWIVRHPFKTVGLVLGFIIIGCLGFLYWVGYMLLGPYPCSDWRPNMTIDEKIFMVLTLANNRDRAPFKTNPGHEREWYEKINIPYDNVESILLTNTDCCHLYSTSTAMTEHPEHWEHMKQRVTNTKDEGTIVIEYMGRYKDKKGPYQVKAGLTRTSLNLNHCK